MKKLLQKLSPGRILALGFALLILLGTFVLWLPVATRAGEQTTFLDALFTSASATCVTGMLMADTYTHWTIFGQLVILGLSHVGALGFITVGTHIAMLTKKKISLQNRTMIHESINTIDLAGVVRLVRKIMVGTLLMEVLGTILLAFRFVPQFGWGRGLYFAFYHSVSAFCNAGFDLMGIRESYSSLTAYEGDILVNVTVMGLILIGGVGFMVWDDVLRNRFCFKKYMLQSKITLAVSGILIFGGALLFYVFEKDGLLAGMNAKESILGAFFMSVTPRTGGMNTTDFSQMGNAGKLLTMVFMFIGGGSGSTAGGVKITTVVVMLLTAVATVRGTRGVNVFGRRLEEDAVRRASVIVCCNLVLTVVGALLLMACQDLSFTDVLIESVSAINTVGLSTGITRQLVPFSKIVLIILMYCGRLGSLTFALVFAQPRSVPPVQQPVEKIVVG